ncbi:MAG: Lrp/AsnC family transcriptional regulator, leucine-responsive regulatory protein [Pseudomonadota bacterium]|jgi:DNA-binding Lrp family transcriptional regulator|nr:Lrp/AsnC family transcriptional regulator, leucine-responsive regulatory protein [Pseudomonadota bacterium]
MDSPDQPDRLDRRDALILNELQRDSRQSVAQIAERVGMSSTSCWKRLRELEARGVVTGYTVTIDREKAGLSLCVIAEVNLAPHTEETVQRFERAVAACPQIVSGYSTTGQSDYVLRVLVSDIKAYERFLHDTMFRLPGVTHVRSSVVLREIKAQARLPVEVPAA